METRRDRLAKLGRCQIVPDVAYRNAADPWRRDVCPVPTERDQRRRSRDGGADPGEGEYGLGEQLLLANRSAKHCCSVA